MTQPYDDAELDAIAVVRLAVAEFERGETINASLHPLLLRVQDDHPQGVPVLVAALARFAGRMASRLVRQDGIGTEEWLDRWPRRTQLERDHSEDTDTDT